MSKRILHTVVQVSLGKHSYPIYIGTGMLRRAGALFRKHALSGTAVIITDSVVARLHLNPLRRSLTGAGITVRTIVIPRGEKEKNLRRAEVIFTQLIRWNIERSSTIVALGGGVVGDLAGFVAATYMRGVKFVQVPTTLLAQVDSSVGGKVGVNHPMAKNMIGAFYQPTFVAADTELLRTLPVREVICGMGEVIKYGILLDKRFFRFVRTHMDEALRHDPEVLTALVKRCCELKTLVVSKDEREGNLRAILNFGHTVGHAIERSGKYSRIKHGEAVLFGMLAETSIAADRSLITRRTMEEIVELIRSVPLPDLSAVPMRTNDLLAAMRKDKKANEGRIRVVLPSAIGKVSLPVPVSRAALRKALNVLKAYAS